MNAFLVLAAATTSSFISAQDTTYTVIEVKRTEHFAGKLGHRVQEALVIESGTKRYEVRVVGAYHTLHMGSKRLKQGDKVRIGGRSNPLDGRIQREDIRAF